MARDRQSLFSGGSSTFSPRDAVCGPHAVPRTASAATDKKGVPADGFDRVARAHRQLSKLRIGIIGCGQLARAAHIPLLERNKDVEIVGLCDASPSTMATCASLAPNAKRYASVDALLDSHSVEAVVISLPSHLHTDAAIAAFRRGAHVYLEKPVASRMDDGRRIVEAWRNSNRIGMIGQNFRFNPLAKKMKETVASGYIGEVRSIDTKYSTPRPALESWRRSRETGGGALLDLAVHHIDFARFALASEIASVSARIESRESDHDSGAISLKFENGATATIDVAFGDSFQDRIEVRGDKGTLWIDRTHSVDVGRAAAAERIGLASIIRAHLPTPGRIRYWALRRQSPFHEPSYAIALSAFVQAATSGAHPSPDLDDGLAALAAVDAAERSSPSGQPVPIGSAGMSLD